jgi:uncharacterized protein with GYD domain
MPFRARRPPLPPGRRPSASDFAEAVGEVKKAPKRSQAAKEMAKKLGVEVKQVYLTSGENDLLLVVESASGDNVAKFALATGSLGNVRTSTSRAWSEPEFP